MISRIQNPAFVLLVLSAGLAFADFVDVDQAEEAARKKYIDRFTNYTQDKNVMGKPANPNGKIIQGNPKTFFDSDGASRLPFQSDLTYHYKTTDDVEIKDKQLVPGGPKETVVNQLPGFISPHGSISGGNGSSRLERDTYALFQKYEEKDQKKKDAEDLAGKEGITYKNVFKITTQKVKKKDPSTVKTNNPDDQFENQSRQELREEVKEQIAKVGEESTESLLKAARDKGRENDANEMPNLTMLYEGAKRATEAMWVATLKGLKQRQIGTEVFSKVTSPEPLAMWQDSATCEAATQGLAKKLAAATTDAQRQTISKEIADTNKKCKQIASTKYGTINPKFERPKQTNPNPGAPLPDEELKTGDTQYEDKIERDMRVQLELMAKTGKRAAEVPSNWTYTEKDDTSRIKQFSEGGDAQGERDVTPQKQIDGYNARLKEVQGGYDEVKSRFPEMEVPNLSQYTIPNATVPMAEINRPTPSMMEEFGVEDAAPSNLPENYDQVIEQSK